MKLHQRLNIDLAVIEEALMDVVRSDSDLPQPSVVYDSVVSLIQAGGKRLRPMMVVIGSRFGNAESQQLQEQQTNRVMRTAAMLEYLHMASLIHDDIIDCADLRRGEPTIHKKTDTRTAVLIANYMMVRAVEWAIGSDDEQSENTGHACRCADLASMVTELCRGEYSQLQHRFDYDTTMEQYLSKTRSKTALLMAHCLKAGAEAAGASRETSTLLFDFGGALGMAFQIRDDLLDFTHTPASAGKPVGADLRNGIITLPVLYAMEDSDLADRIRALHAEAPSEQFDAVIAEIGRTDALAQAEELSEAYVKQAHRIMSRLGNHSALPGLEALADYFA